MQGELKGETQEKSMTDSHDVPLADVGNSISKCHRNITTIKQLLVCTVVHNEKTNAK